MRSPKPKIEFALLDSWNSDINLGDGTQLQPQVRQDNIQQDVKPTGVKEITKEFSPIENNTKVDDLYASAVNAPDLSLEDISWNNPDHKRKILDSMIVQESGGNPNVTSVAGARGNAQVMPKTWGDAIKYGWVKPTDDPYDPKLGLYVQEKYMDWLMNMNLIASAPTEKERIKRALAAYNHGIGNLQKVFNRAAKDGVSWEEALPKETKNYLPAVLNRFIKTKNSDYTNMFGRNVQTMKFGGILFKQ